MIILIFCFFLLLLLLFIYFLIYFTLLSCLSINSTCMVVVKASELKSKPDTLAPSLFKIHFHVILQSIPRLSKNSTSVLYKKNVQCMS